MPLAHDLGKFTSQLRESVRLVRLAVGLAWTAGPALFAAILLLLLLEAALPVAQLAFSKAALDQLLAGERNAAALTRTILLAAIVTDATQVLRPFSETFQAMAGDRLTGSLTARLMAAANSWRGMARFEDPAMADDLYRARRFAARSGIDLTRETGHAAFALMGALALGAALFALHPLAPVIVCAACAPQLLWQYEAMSRTGSHLYVQSAEARRLEYYRHVSLGPEVAKDVRLFGLTPFLRGRYDGAFERAVGSLAALRRRLAGRSAFGTALASLGVGAVYVYVVWRASRGGLTVGDVALFGGAAALLQARLLNVGQMVGALPRELGFLPALDRVLHAQPDLPLPSRPRPAPVPMRQGIAFEDVWFAYPGYPGPGRPAPVLRGVSFSLRTRESLALVGHNGAGKTTIVKLLLRLYDPTAGRITLDGVDLREYDLDALRRRMGAIFQDFVRYELAARENVAVGDLSALSDEGRLLSAAQKAGADELLRALPQGLDTVLGRQFGGRELSGGEWQKLALARAFVRDCDLLVLDEPTAALDVRSEYEVYLRFKELTEGRTTLLISHRFSTVRMADRILYLDDGQIQEEGTHAELMVRGGEYARLYRLQASQYAPAANAAAEAAP